MCAIPPFLMRSYYVSIDAIDDKSDLKHQKNGRFYELLKNKYV